MSGAAPPCLVLASGRGQRRLDPNASFPNSLRDLPGLGRVLLWNLAALDQARVAEVSLVGGYHLEKLVSLRPGLRCFFHAAWMHEGPAGALRAAAPALSGELLLCTDRCVFRGAAVRRLLEPAAATAGVVLGRAGEGEPALLRLSAPAARERLRRVESVHPATDLGTLARELERAGHPLLELDLRPEACRVDAPLELARFVFGTKAETLDRLRPLLRRSRVLPQARFTAAEWDQDPDGVLARVEAELGRGRLVVRSAALAEDSFAASRAGEFLSVLGIDGADQQALRAAIAAVRQSYRARGADEPGNQVLVQPALGDVRAAGVLLTRKPGDGAPYWVLDLERAARTDGVTAGRAGQLVSHAVPRDTPPERIAPGEVRALIEAAREVEELVLHDRLDLEVALVGPAEEVVLLQARPLLIPAAKGFELADEDLFQEVALAEAQVARLLAPRPGLAGTSNLLGNMPDWNPAEIVGVAPRALAFSLYRAVIGDRVWAEARRALGYADATCAPLLVGIAGRPYVQVQASFTSLLPAGLDPGAADRLVDAALRALVDEPALHDKVEFELIPTCRDFAWERYQARLLPRGARPQDLEAAAGAHAALTTRLVRGQVAPPALELERLVALEAWRARLAAWPRRAPWDRLDAARTLLERLRPLGTRPFASLARQAFVALALLRSLSARGALRPEWLGEWLAALPSVAGEVSARLSAAASDAAARAELLGWAGHLRPGTYDLLSPSYRDAPDLYLGGTAPPQRDPRELAARRRALDEELLAGRGAFERLAREAGLAFAPEELLSFAAAAIPAREQAKFEFSRALSWLLDQLAQFGQEVGLSRELLADLPLRELLDVAVQGPHAIQVEEWTRIAGLNQKRHQLTRAICLPDLIASPEAVRVVTARAARPNFVGRGCVTAEPLLLEGARERRPDLRGKLVLVRSADPGFDWLFTHGPAGLITEHGGVASHMAIRAAELRLPAAIGCGRLRFDALARARLVRLDCGAEQVQGLP